MLSRPPIAIVLFVVSALLASAPLSCGRPTPEGLTIFAAASLRPTLDAVAAAYTRSTSVPVRVVYGASSTMARQIHAGGPADVFVSADRRWVSWLAERHAIDAPSAKPIASNRLVLVAPIASPFQWSPSQPLAPAFDGRLALADPSHVPAGRYAKAALIALGVWDDLADRIVPAADVRAALRFVTADAAGAGIVYATDAASTNAVIKVADIPATAHPAIAYIAVPTKRQVQAAHALTQWMSGDTAAAHFTRAGFRAATTAPAP